MYHVSATLAVARRILAQLGHDHRTLALVFVMPCVLLSLLAWLYSDNSRAFNMVAPALLAIFPMTIMFLITSIATLRERTSGTLERVLAMPIGRLDFILGYALAFGSLAIIQSLITSFVALQLLGLDVVGPSWFLVVVAFMDALLGMALGLLVSAFAHNEFQAVQFMPVVILPQFLLCGLLVPLSKMPDILEAIAHFLPMTYAVEALQNVALQTTISDDSWRDILVVGGSVIGAILLGGLTLRRRTK